MWETIGYKRDAVRKSLTRLDGLEPSANRLEGATSNAAKYCVVVIPSLVKLTIT